MESRINLRLPAEDVKRWKHAALDQEITLSELVRRSVNAYLETLQKDKERQ